MNWWVGLFLNFKFSGLSCWACLSNAGSFFASSVEVLHGSESEAGEWPSKWTFGSKPPAGGPYQPFRCQDTINQQSDNISCTISDLGARVGSKWEPASVTSSHFLSHERCPALQTIVGTEALLVSAWRSLESLDKTKIQVGLVSFP